MDDSRDRELTVRELREEIEGWPDDARIIFGSTIDGDPLVFSRFKDRSGGRPKSVLHIELIEKSVNDRAVRS